jgi:hypothetical protein
MKKIFLVFVLVLGMVMGGNVWAISINEGTFNGTDVGGRDYLLYWATLSEVGSSGDGDVLKWVNNKLGSDYDTMSVEANQWYTTTQYGTVAASLPDTPGYFLVKTGNLQTSDYEFFLYSNLASTSWAVINLYDSIQQGIAGGLGANTSVTVTKISHLNDFGGTSVPEPNVLLLLGSSLFGVGALARKMKK